MQYVEIAIAVAKTVTLVLGGLITFFALKAYRRTGSPALRALAIGFAVVTLGSLLAGSLDVLTGVGFEYSVLTQSVVTAAGFALVTYALYAE